MDGVLLSIAGGVFVGGTSALAADSRNMSGGFVEDACGFRGRRVEDVEGE